MDDGFFSTLRPDITLAELLAETPRAPIMDTKATLRLPPDTTLKDLLVSHEQLFREILPKENLLINGATQPGGDQITVDEYLKQWHEWTDQLFSLRDCEEELRMLYDQLIEIETMYARYVDSVIS